MKIALELKAIFTPEMKSLLFVCGHSFPCYHIDLGLKASSLKINKQVSQKTCMLKVPRPYNVVCEE